MSAILPVSSDAPRARKVTLEFNDAIVRQFVLATLVWGIVQIGVALAVRNQPGSALNQALSVASLINGPILGVFLVGTFLRRVSQPPALIGMLASIAVMLYIFFGRPEIAWTWYVLIGSAITFVVAWLASFVFWPAPAEMRDELSPAVVTEE